MTVISAFGKLRQENRPKLKVSLDYTARSEVK